MIQHSNLIKMILYVLTIYIYVTLSTESLFANTSRYFYEIFHFINDQMNTKKDASSPSSFHTTRVDTSSNKEQNKTIYVIKIINWLIAANIIIAMIFVCVYVWSCWCMRKSSINEMHDDGTNVYNIKRRKKKQNQDGKDLFL